MTATLFLSFRKLRYLQFLELQKSLLMEVSFANDSHDSDFFTEPLLNLIDVPSNVMPQAKIYMQIVFAGQIPALMYNFGAAILRSKGDTKRPLYIITISGIINVLLNLFFVINLKMRAEGVALATVISQVFTAVTIVYILRKQTDCTRLDFKKLSINKKQLISIMKVGIPSGIQSSIFSIANVLIQSSVNGFGSAAVWDILLQV